MPHRLQYGKHVFLSTSPWSQFLMMPRNLLSVTDHRTGRYYEIPIERNAVRAAHLKRVTVPTDAVDESDRAHEPQKGLRILDPGLRHTAVVESKVAHLYADRTPISCCHVGCPYYQSFEKLTKRKIRDLAGLAERVR